MKIVFTGGGTGGHFYPIIAVAQAINTIIKQRKLVDARLYYLATAPYDEVSLFENHLEFKAVPAGKIRRYFSIKNFFDIFKTIRGIIIALWQLYVIYPDVVFSKGGYDSFPTLWAARFLKIPVVMHESDSHPGRVSLWSAKFAKRIALSYPEANHYFNDKPVAITGNPIRQELLNPITIGAHEFLKLEKGVQIIFVTGGSSGASVINDTLVDILPQLTKKYQIIHQIGIDNFEEIKQRAFFLLTEQEQKNRYHPFPFLNTSAMRMLAGISDLVITRAGSVLFEIAVWGLPAIIIPIPETISHDQRTNAFTYARSGGAVVIEQDNLTPSVLQSEINRLLENESLRNKMKAGAKNFAHPNAANVIAEEIIALALKHEE